MRIPSSITKALAKRKAENSFRELSLPNHRIDFSSNDYLGMASNPNFLAYLQQCLPAYSVLKSGATGSRLIAGNHAYYAQTEAQLAELFQAEAVLIFNSGYHANQAVAACLPQRGDTVLYDQLAHVCIKEGVWLSKAKYFAYRHNDLNDLEQKLKNAEGQRFIFTETVFSMDGDIAPIADIVKLAEQYDAHIIVDEAHSTGVYGQHGAGWLCQYNLHQKIFARVYTFGKAMGVHGACVAGPKILIDYLVNFARPFIYTTALPPHSVMSIAAAFKFLQEHPDLPNRLFDNIATFRNHFPQAISDTAIQPIMISGNTACRAVAKDLQTAEYEVKAILAPTVPEGAERLRISLHADHTDTQISDLAALLTSKILG